MDKHKHDARIIYDGTENYTTSIRWCSKCGSIYHPKRLKNGALSKRLYWQKPRSMTHRMFPFCGEKK